MLFDLMTVCHGVWPSHVRLCERCGCISGILTLYTCRHAQLPLYGAKSLASIFEYSPISVRHV
jgi:hypothetical protein